MINNSNNPNINNFAPAKTGSVIGVGDHKHSDALANPADTESFNETISSLKNSISQNRNDRVRYDMTGLDSDQDDNFKFLT